MWSGLYARELLTNYDLWHRIDISCYGFEREKNFNLSSKVAKLRSIDKVSILTGKT